MIRKLLDRFRPQPAFRPLVAPFGVELTRDDVRDVWNTWVKPDQDSGNVQSAEMRTLMAILRAAYLALPPTEDEP